MKILKWLAFPFVFLGYKIQESLLFLGLIILVTAAITGVVFLFGGLFVWLAPDTWSIVWIHGGGFFPFYDWEHIMLTGTAITLSVLGLVGGFFYLKEILDLLIYLIHDNIQKTKDTLGL